MVRKSKNVQKLDIEVVANNVPLDEREKLSPAQIDNSLSVSFFGLKAVWKRTVTYLSQKS